MFSCFAFKNEENEKVLFQHFPTQRDEKVRKAKRASAEPQTLYEGAAAAYVEAGESIVERMRTTSAR